VIDAIEEALKKVLEEYRSGKSSLSIEFRSRGRYAYSGWYINHTVKTATARIEIEYYTSEIDSETIEKLNELIENFQWEIECLIDDVINETISARGYRVIDVDADDGCTDYIIDVDGARTSIGLCIDTFNNRGCGFYIDTVSYPPLKEVQKIISEQIDKIESLKNLAKEYPNVAVVLGLRNIGYRDVVKVMRLGNSRVVAVPLEAGKHVKRYQATDKIVCIEVID